MVPLTSTDPILVRPIQPADETRVADLLIRSFNETYARKMPEVIMTDRRRQELSDVPGMHRQGARILVAERAGKIIGTVSLFPPGFPGGHVWLPRTAELRFLAIDPELQGGGLAEPLVAECLRVAYEEWKCDGIALHTRRGAHGVARFYEKRGWKRVPAGDKDRLPEVYLEAYLLTLG